MPFTYRRQRDDLRSPKPFDPRAEQDSTYCEIKKECGSCTYINENYERSTQEKFQKGLNVLSEKKLLNGANILGVQESPQVYNYRCHTKLAVRSCKSFSTTEVGVQQDRFAIGLFKPQSHEVIDLKACPVQPQETNTLIAMLKTLLSNSQLYPYDEQTGSGEVRYIAIRQAHRTGALMLTVVATRDIRAELKPIVSELRKAPIKLVSMNLNINEKPGNHIFGDTTHNLSGVAKLRESLCDFLFEISPTSFFQVNPWAASLTYRRIEQLAGESTKNAIAWDFFSGIGQISLLLARAGFKTIGIEENPRAVADAEQNTQINELTNSVSFICGRTEEVQQQIPRELSQPDLIVANPSRKGIPPETIEFISRALAQKKSSRLIYMSCAVESLARDLEFFSKKSFSLRQIEAFDMFPFTNKLEWLCVLTRS